MPEPRPKVSASTQGVRMPMALAMARFWVTARICRPKRVKRSTTSSRTNTAAAKTMIHMRLLVIVRLPKLKAPDIHDGLPTSRLFGPKMVRTVCCRMSETPQVASSVSSGRP